MINPCWTSSCLFCHLFSCSAHSFLLQSLSVFLITLVLLLYPFIYILFFLRQETACYSSYIHHAFVWWCSDLLWFTLYSGSNNVQFDFLRTTEGCTDILAPKSPCCLFFQSLYCLQINLRLPHISPFHAYPYCFSPGKLSPSLPVLKEPSAVPYNCVSFFLPVSKLRHLLLLTFADHVGICWTTWVKTPISVHFSDCFTLIALIIHSRLFCLMLNCCLSTHGSFFLLW